MCAPSALCLPSDFVQCKSLAPSADAEFITSFPNNEIFQLVVTKGAQIQAWAVTKDLTSPKLGGGRSIIRKKCWDGVGEEDSWAPVAGASMRVDFTRVVPCYGPRVWACVLKLVALVVL